MQLLASQVMGNERGIGIVDRRDDGAVCSDGKIGRGRSIQIRMESGNIVEGTGEIERPVGHPDIGHSIGAGQDAPAGGGRIIDFTGNPLAQPWGHGAKPFAGFTVNRNPTELATGTVIFEHQGGGIRVEV